MWSWWGSWKKTSLICQLIRMYCREINIRIISFAIYFWLIFSQALKCAFHQSSTLERNDMNFNSSAIFACKIFKIVSAEAMGSSGGHLFKEIWNNGSLVIKIKMEITSGCRRQMSIAFTILWHFAWMNYSWVVAFGKFWSLVVFWSLWKMQIQAPHFMLM